MNLPGKENLSCCAAAYVRMSTEHQQYSASNQMEAIQAYAQQQGLEIEKVYSDGNRSGLTFQDRPALRQLISEVVAGNVNISKILVYDVSRWGRFQNADEAAHFEFLCRKAGVTVHYCAEEFAEDGSLTAVIAKGLKRAMAGEYSRELSAKVFQATCHLAQHGYFVGGSALLGLRRMLVDQHRQPKIPLHTGDQKQIQYDRVILVPGPEAEIRVVRSIFQSFVNDRLGPTEIARQLNRQSIPSASSRPWTDVKIRNALLNEKYIGNMVYARRSAKLGTKSIPNPPDRWIRGENAFPAIVPRELFFQAQARYQNDGLKFEYSEAELLDKLRGLYEKNGYLTENLINESPETPSAGRYIERFGSLVTAYRLIGFRSRRSYRQLSGHLTQIRREMIRAVICKVQSLGGGARWVGRRRQLVINDELRIRVYFLSHDKSDAGTSYWRIHHGIRFESDLTLAVRMDDGNQQIKDYYLLPHLEGRWEELHLLERNGIYVDAFRFSTLDFLVSLAARTRLREAV